VTWARRSRTAGAAVGLLVLLCLPQASAPAAAPPTTSFKEAGDRAVSTLLHVFYAGDGFWYECNDPGCNKSNQDWGVDALTYTLYLRWKTTHDRSVVPTMRALIGTATSYGPPCTGLPCPTWSDVPEWDAIASMRTYEATGHDPRALAKAKAAFDYVERAKVFALGACPRIRYQLPMGAGNRLKTLESDANAIKAALLLYRATRGKAYLASATTHYRAVRTYFLDPKVPLYTVYVFDDGKRCKQLPRRFFASVNGDMIWNGLELYRITGNGHYLGEAIATAKAVDRYLSNSRGVFTDLQAENDVVEPLVEAMYDLAKRQHLSFARRWILRNAAAALSARAPDGALGRFFDGPVPKTTITAWQSNGGLAIQIAAAALAPRTRAPTESLWAGARLVSQAVATVPATVTFSGRGVAFLGTLGEQCCEPGHARVFVDGRETFDRTGIWQNKSSSGRSIPNSVLFAWQWPKPGRHTIRFEPGVANAKEGGPFLHLQGYLVR
jgi:hypothetical protein